MLQARASQVQARGIASLTARCRSRTASAGPAVSTVLPVGRLVEWTNSCEAMEHHGSAVRVLPAVADNLSKEKWLKSAKTLVRVEET